MRIPHQNAPMECMIRVIHYNNSKHSHYSYCVLGPVLKVLHTLAHLNLITSLVIGTIIYPNFTNEEPEAQRLSKFAQGHTANKVTVWDSKPGHPGSYPWLYPIHEGWINEVKNK